MAQIFGKSYYIDIDGIIEKCQSSKKEKNDETNEINIFKYELIKMCLERVLDEFSDTDENIGIFNTDQNMSFKIAFNTLINNEIIIEEDE